MAVCVLSCSQLDFSTDQDLLLRKGCYPQWLDLPTLINLVKTVPHRHAHCRQSFNETFSPGHARLCQVDKADSLGQGARRRYTLKGWVCRISAQKLPPFCNHMPFPQTIPDLELALDS